MADLNELITDLTADDWKEAFIAIRRQMIVAIENPNETYKSSEYYENLAIKIDKIRFNVLKKERDYE